MRIAALYDIHGNLPALEAVLQEIRQAEADQVVVGGNVIPGPMPRETLACLRDLDIPVPIGFYLGPTFSYGALLTISRKPPRRIRGTKYPQAEEFAARNVLQPPSEGEVLEAFTRAELK